MIYFMGFRDALERVNATKDDIEKHICDFTFITNNDVFIEEAIDTNDLTKNEDLFKDTYYTFKRKELFSQEYDLSMRGGMVHKHRTLNMLMREFTSN